MLLLQIVSVKLFIQVTNANEGEKMLGLKPGLISSIKLKSLFTEESKSII